jgi:alpha-tubulin suppressor-like RCC1 family protein
VRHSRWYLWALLLVTAAGCFHRFPEEAPLTFGPCAELGALACHVPAGRLRLLCDGMNWVAYGSCDSNQNCDQPTATCRQIVPGCVDHAGGDLVCDGRDVRRCGADLVTDTYVETCPRFCHRGACVAIEQLAAGAGHTCVVLTDGAAYCWGSGGPLPIGGPPLGIEPRLPIGFVQFEAPIRQIAPGGLHTCVLLANNKVRCWGTGILGQLGYASTDSVDAAAAGDVDVGNGLITRIVAGGGHTCVLFETGRVRCWGHGLDGQLGYGNRDTIGDTEVPSSAGDVNVGGIVTALAAGGRHTCALLDTGRVRCWGNAGNGELGYGTTESIGDDESPGAVGNVDVGGGIAVTQIAAGGTHTCVLLATGKVRCWGNGNFGKLGYASTSNIGDDELPASAGDVEVDPGQEIMVLQAGGDHTCVLLESGQTRCWGYNRYGQLGLGDMRYIGDDEPPSSGGYAALGEGQIVANLTTGLAHSCVLLDRGAVRCWGQGQYGALGYRDLENIGDDETPASAGDVPLF